MIHRPVRLIVAISHALATADRKGILADAILVATYAHDQLLYTKRMLATISLANLWFGLTNYKNFPIPL